MAQIIYGQSSHPDISLQGTKEGQQVPTVGRLGRNHGTASARTDRVKCEQLWAEAGLQGGGITGVGRGVRG